MNSNQDWLPYWQPNDICLTCNSSECDIIFNFLNRKHHCRKCGLIFCDKCWGNLSYVKPYDKKVPVCYTCYENIESIKN